VNKPRSTKDVVSFKS